MNTSHKVHVNTFDGALNTDADLHVMRPNDFRAALNMRSGKGDREGAMTPAKGNTLVAYGFDLPAGTNTAIGAFEDQQNDGIVIFIKNSNNDHLILRRIGSDTQILAQGSYLNFSNRITHAKIVDDLLYWTDATDRTGTLTGNPLRKINMVKANTEKRLEYRLIFGDNSFTENAQYRIEVEDADGNTITTSQILYTVPSTPTVAGVLSALITELDSFDIDAESSYVGGSPVLTMSHQTAQYRIFLTGVTGGSVDNYIRFVPHNWYGDNLNTERIQMIKPVPYCAPKPRYVADAGILTNRLFGFGFQFRYRFIFDDAEKSRWSSASYVPTNFKARTGATFTLDNDPSLNTIRVFMEDDRLDSEDWLSIIRSVEVCFRTSVEQPWRLIDRYPVEALGVESHYITFVNEGGYPVVPSDEPSAPDAQALGNFDFVPNLATTLETVSDIDGNYIMLVGGCKEGYEVDDIRATVEVIETVDSIASPQISDYKTMKAGGTYGVYSVYEDEFGRQGPANYLDTVRVPFTLESLQVRYFRIDFDDPPPLWARRYKIAITPNQNQSIYAQLPAWRVLYWQYDATNDNMKSVGYGGSPDYVGLEFNIGDLQPGAFRNYIFDTLQGRTSAFIPQTRDRLQILGFTTDELLSGDLGDFNLPIAGYSLTYPNSQGSSIDRFTVFFKHDSNLPEIDLDDPQHWVLVEIYRPNTGDLSQIAYEIGDCYDIIDYGTASATHDQPTGGYVSLLGYGDTYVSGQLFYDNLSSGGGPYEVEIPAIERVSMDFSSTDVINDLGRPVVDDEDETELFQYEKIRASQIYISNSGVNGLSTFRGIDYVRVKRSFGSIQGLKMAGNVLLAICRFKTQPIYVSRQALLSITGDTLQAISSRLLTVADEVQMDLGTNHPESIVYNEGNVYAFSNDQGKFWRYSAGGGQFPISNYGFFKDSTALGKATTRVNEVIAGFQKEFETVYWRFPARTIAFKEGNEPGWGGDFSFLPESMVEDGINFYTLSGGLLYLQESGTNSNYFGVQYNNEVTFVINSDPLSMKLFWHCVLLATKKFRAPEVTIEATASYPDGMLSEIPANRVNLYEGQWKADFLRDSSDPRYDDIETESIRYATALLKGRELRGEILIVKLRLNTPGEDFVLRAFETFYTKSEPTL